MHNLPEDPLKLMSVIAALCSDLGLHDRALDIFERLAALRDNHANALVPWAIAQSRAGNEAVARQTLRRALAADPEHDMARVMLAIHLHEARDPEAAVLLRTVLARRDDEQRDADALALAESVQADILQTTTRAERAIRLQYTRVDLHPINSTVSPR
jgi:Tfp pilus assembly protein PilF